MGLLSPSSQLDLLSGEKGADAAQFAALQQAQAITKAIKTIRSSQQQALGAIQPFQQAGLAQLPGLQAGATPQGFGANLEAIISGGALDPLIAERGRAAQGQLSQAGLSRSGFGGGFLGDISQETIFGLEALLTGRQQNLAGVGFGAAQNIANIQGQGGANIANLLTGRGEALALGTLGQAQAQAQGAQNLFGISTQLGQSIFTPGKGGGGGGASSLGSLFSGIGGGGGAEEGGTAAGTGTGAGAGAGAGTAVLSDERLKQDITPVGKIGPLTLYSWNPNEKGIELGMESDVGFIAQDVQKLFPHAVVEKEGFLAVSYDTVGRELSGEVITWQ